MVTVRYTRDFQNVFVIGTQLLLWASPRASGVPRNFVRGGGVQQFQLRTEDRTGPGGGSPLVRGSGGSCNLVQKISFHIVKFSQFSVHYIKLFMMTTNVFVIANVKKIANLGSFNSFHNCVDFGTILEGLRNFGRGGGWCQTPPPVRHYRGPHV